MFSRIVIVSFVLVFVKQTSFSQFIYYDRSTDTDWKKISEMVESGRKIRDSLQNLGYPAETFFLHHVGKRIWMSIDGRFDVFEWTGSKWVNLYKGTHHGYNHKSERFTFRDKLFSYRGYGFWREHGEIIEFLPQNGGLAYHSIISPAGGTGPYFDWVYDVAESTVIGLNHTEICDAEGEVDVTVRVTGTSLPFYPQTRQVGISILQNPDAPPFIANNESNDNGTTVIQINAPLPIDLMSFDVFSDECNKVHLVWKTASEINNDFVEVQRSEDGRVFKTIGKMKGTNTTKITSYQFIDGEVNDGALYYYRLRQVDYDGTEKIFDPITVRTLSCQNNRAISVYPNPVMNKLNLVFTGFDESDDLTYTITNSIGETIRTSENVSPSELKELDVHILVSGMYNLRIENAGQTFIQRFVKI